MLPTIFKDNDFETVGELFFNLDKFHWPNYRTNMLKVDVTEDDNNFEIIADVAGLDKKDVKVIVKNSVLTIKVNKEDKEEKKKYLCRGIIQTSNERNFELPDTVDADKIEAVQKNGRLKVTIPKAEASYKEISIS